MQINIQPTIYKNTNISMKSIYLPKYNKNKIYKNGRL